ncbi:N-acetylmuramoyl-L-alanine amidase family protein [Deinococcus radiophilus]|uniref:N-acetylmuramoyl-L-alanine amidase n=1 Tax=Deinococcus radiophilus TaxID=32062 RepID=A0A3S0KAC3_9DEIO|nr:N-acetylmuramoyl-L-alanine amidase [Deinococcus radiophilus]RTR26242.1 N-acetylmuramoyl-L-alanine amidase [Deinococcus radiophilus]UFA50306.1 N-acetylmuramoyl-L-alanine amidase [Deinococcus radiophilus]
MKSRALFLSTLLGGVGWASAQTDPFQRTAPVSVLPVLSGSESAGVAPAAELTLAQGQTSSTPATPATTFGAPRSSGQPGGTRVVFDLPQGARYALVPSYTGLTVRVEGATVQPGSQGALGEAVTSYRAGGSQVTLTTPYPLNAVSGWKASEATIASGTRVLILDFGPALQGGAAGSGLQAMLPGSAPASSSMAAAQTAPLALAAAPMARAGGTQALGRSNSPYQLPATPVRQTEAPLVVTPRYTTPAAAPTPAPAPAAVARAAIPATPAEAPGDSVVHAVPEALPPELANASGYTDASDLSGRVPGQTGNNTLTQPRVGKSPGMTRVVVDLPPGASYQIMPQGSGLNVQISGVRAQAGGESSVSPELKSWAYRASGGGISLSLSTGSAATAARGWRAFFLPPSDGSTDRYRLAIDVAPALANLRPITNPERNLSRLASLPSGGGLAYASAVKPRVVLDPGHGGSDPGAVGQIQEKKLVLDVALRTRQFLNAAGIDVVMTRDRDVALNANKATDLRMRANMGSAGQAFVSIHANAMPASTALRGFGIETWYNANHRLSPAFATIMQKNMVDASGAFSRGIKNQQSLGVLRTNRVPAALVEVGFLSHPVDSINLMNQNYVDRVALGIAKGVHESLRTGVHAAPSEVVGLMPTAVTD